MGCPTDAKRSTNVSYVPAALNRGAFLYTGFKAGALANGLEKSKGEYLAIFDADFLPQPDFLKKVLPHFDHEKIAFVQARWGHLNRNYSLLSICKMWVFRDD